MKEEENSEKLRKRPVSCAFTTDVYVFFTNVFVFSIFVKKTPLDDNRFNKLNEEKNHIKGRLT
jgi:hypothetical protein